MSDSPGLVDFAILFSSVLVLIKNICTTSFFTDKVASVSYKNYVLEMQFS